MKKKKKRVSEHMYARREWEGGGTRCLYSATTDPSRFLCALYVFCVFFFPPVNNKYIIVVLSRYCRAARKWTKQTDRRRVRAS